MDQLLAEEEQDPASRLNIPFDKNEQQRSDAAEREAEFPQRGEVGRVRAGRLVAPDDTAALGQAHLPETQSVRVDSSKSQGFWPLLDPDGQAE
ncbi:MAG: hypothetical protein ACXWZX_14930, partial [Mycobacterium sp.]